VDKKGIFFCFILCGFVGGEEEGCDLSLKKKVYYHFKKNKRYFCLKECLCYVAGVKKARLFGSYKHD